MARTLDIVGEKWALLAIREVFLGNRRFDEMVRRTGAPRDTLAARLRTLVGTGILERRPYSEHPARFEYYLTAAGRDLYPVIVTLIRWGDQYLADDKGPPLILQHHCGHQLTAQVICQACGEPLEARDTTPLTQPTGTVSRSAADLAGLSPHHRTRRHPSDEMNPGFHLALARWMSSFIALAIDADGPALAAGRVDDLPGDKASVF
jgi:DNA-binding HxlR family transcriptional regulator